MLSIVLLWRRTCAGSLRRFQRARREGIRRQLVISALIVSVAVIAGVLRYSGAPDIVVFVVSAVALAGLAWLVSTATEAIGGHFGPAVTGVLQSTLGNLPELFVVLFALAGGELVVARTSIVGSLLANALLVLGLVIIVGARRAPDKVMRFDKRLPADTSTLLILAMGTISLLGLSVASADPASHHKEAISAIGSICLLAVYGTWLVRYLRDERAGPQKAKPAGHAAEMRAEQSPLPLSVAAILLGIAGVAAAFVSDWFISALDPALAVLHLSKPFAGLVIVAIAGNAVENVTGIVLASKGQSDLAISVVKNSVSQVALFLYPVLILASLLFSTHLTFQLEPVYIGALVLTAFSLWQITGDGAAYAFEGLSLVALYVILGVVAFFE